MSGAFLTSFRYAPVFESSEIQTGWWSANLHQMAEDSFNLIRILDHHWLLALSTSIAIHEISVFHECVFVS